MKAVLLNDTRNDRHHGCTTVIETIERLCDENGIRIMASSPAHSDWGGNGAIRDAIECADLVLVNGEGTIHHDRPAGERLVAAGQYARSRGKKSALINTTWEANSPRLAEMAKSFDVISVRESVSAGELEAFDIPCRIVPDLALYHQPPSAVARSAVAYTDCVVGPTALELHSRMSTLGAEPVNLLFDRRSPRDFLTSLRRLLRGRSVHAGGKMRAAIRAAMAEWRSQTDCRDRFSEIVSRRQLLVTGRFHMLIFALAARTPFLVVSSNTRKNEATLADAGLERWRHVEVEAIDETLLERASHWTPEEADRLDTFLADGRANIRQLFADIRTL